jgi:hypothetical protein
MPVWRHRSVTPSVTANLILFCAGKVKLPEREAAPRDQRGITCGQDRTSFGQKWITLLVRGRRIAECRFAPRGLSACGFNRQAEIFGSMQDFGKKSFSAEPITIAASAALSIVRLESATTRLCSRAMVSGQDKAASDTCAPCSRTGQPDLQSRSQMPITLTGNQSQPFFEQCDRATEIVLAASG